MPVRGDLPAVRAGRRGGRHPRPDPDERPLRVGERSRRYVRTGRRTWATSRVPRLRLEREVGLPARRARDVDRVRPADGARARSWSASASGARARRRCSSSPGRAYPFTAYTLNANTNDAIMPAFLLWGFWLVPPVARGASVALAGWTKFGALLARAALGDVSDARASTACPFAAAFAAVTVPPSRCSCSSRRSGRPHDVLGAHDRVPGRRGTRPSRSGAGASTTPRGSRTSASSSRSSARSPSRSRARGVCPAKEGAGRARRAHCGGPRRLPALADPLVLPLPPVGLPFVVPLAAPPGARASGDADADGFDRGRLARLGVAVDERALDTNPALSGLEADRQSRSACAGSRDRPRRRSRSRAGPVIPASVMNAVPPGSTRASEVWTCVCVPTTAVTRPSSQRASATFSLVASAWTSTRTTGVSRRASSTRPSISSNIDVAGWRNREPRTLMTRELRPVSPPARRRARARVLRRRVRGPHDAVGRSRYGPISAAPERVVAEGDRVDAHLEDAGRRGAA